MPDADPISPFVKAILVAFYANVYLWVGLFYGIVLDRIIMPPVDPQKSKPIITIEVIIQVAVLAIGNYVIRTLAHGIPVAAGVLGTETTKKYKTDFALTLAITLSAQNLLKKLNILVPKLQNAAQ